LKPVLIKTTKENPQKNHNYENTAIELSKEPQKYLNEKIKDYINERTKEALDRT